MKLLAFVIGLFTLGNLYAQQNLPLNPIDSTAFYVLTVSPARAGEWAQSGRIKIIRKVSHGEYVVQATNDLVAANGSVLARLTGSRWKAAGKSIAKNHRTFSLATTGNAAFKSYCRENKLSCEIVQEHAQSNTLLVRTHAASTLKKLLACPFVVFADPHISRATEETEISYADNSVNKINLVHDQFPQLTGEGLHASVKERAFDTLDIDLQGRTVASTLADGDVTYHANQMATLIAGAGNTTVASRGAAWGATLSSSSFDNLFPDNNATLVALTASVQNHSYGTLIENYYGAEARAYDLACNINPTLLHVFSSGNLGTRISTDGQYAGLVGVATLSGNFKQSKNTLCVSSTYRDLSMDERASSGPTYDGRIKPELVAYGQEGTSDAAATTSGAALLVQHAYLKKNNRLPSASLVKAILIASADDIAAQGPDYRTGYGALNAFRGVVIADQAQHWSDSIATHEEKVLTLTVPPAKKKLTVVLSWNDPPAAAGSVTALVNNLDLSVSNGSTRWKPWVLSTAAHVDSLAKPARRGHDAINTLEMITIDLPEAGNYQLQVKAASLFTTLQNFDVAYSYEAVDSFFFTYPTKSDVVDNGKEQYIRWQNTTAIDGALEVKYNDGPWQLLASAAALTNGFYQWQPPSIFTQATLRMHINGSYRESDVFTLSPAMPLEIGFNCTADFMLAWHPQAEASGYQLFSLGEKYMELLANTADTFRVVVKQPVTSLYYAVAPVINHTSGLRGTAYNYQTQGVNCYYTSFTGTLTTNNTARLRLTLSTRYNIRAIRFEKISTEGSQLLGRVNSTGALAYEFEDANLPGGISRYRAVIELLDGRIIETEIADIYFGDERTYEVFPNPVSTHALVTLLTDGNNLTFHLYDATGKEIKREAVFGLLYRVPLASVQPGLYSYRFKRANSMVASGRLLVQ
jgi:hypothetical protein